MSRLIFQGAVTLLSAQPQENQDWLLSIRFRDNEGVFSATDIAAGDVVILDTGFFETGTLTRYEVVACISAYWSGEATIHVTYMDDNDNRRANPDIQWLSGTDGVISRPSPVHDLLPSPSPEIQRISDKFSHFIYNFNNRSILDQFGADGIQSFDELNVGIVSPKLGLTDQGNAVLPSRPYGVPIFNMAMLHLIGGTTINLDGVHFVEDNGTYLVQLETADYERFKDEALYITVSYLGDLDQRIAFSSLFTSEILPGFNYNSGQALRDIYTTLHSDSFDYDHYLKVLSDIYTQKYSDGFVYSHVTQMKQIEDMFLNNLLRGFAKPTH